MNIDARTVPAISLESFNYENDRGRRRRFDALPLLLLLMQNI